MNVNYIKRTEHYIETETRRYFPNASGVCADFDDESEQIHVVVYVPPEGDGALGPLELIWAYTCRIGSDDDRYLFTAQKNADAPEGSFFTIPLMPEPTEPLWVTDRYTDEERDTFIENVMDEMRDSIKDMAKGQLDNMDKYELDFYLIDVETLQALHQMENPPEGTTLDELEATIQCDTDSITTAIRLGYAVEIPEAPHFKVTDDGVAFLQENC